MGHGSISLNICALLMKWTTTFTAKEAWGILSDIVKDNKRYRTNALKVELCSIKLGDRSMESYFQKVDSIVNILTSFDARVNKEDVVHCVLDGLPKTYNQVYGYMHYRDTFPDLKTVRSLLITEEMRLKSKSLSLLVDSSSSSLVVLMAQSGVNCRPTTSQTTAPPAHPALSPTTPPQQSSTLGTLGQATVLHHAFTVGTLHDHITGAWHMDTASMDSCWTCGNPFHSYENCPKEIASRKERVPKAYDYRSKYDAYEYDTYHTDYNIEMEDDTMYRESNKEENQKYKASFAAHNASFVALETHVDRLLDQLNRDETYEPQGITVLDFDNEDEDEGEEKNKEFTLHSTNTMEWSAFGSCKDKEDADDHNKSFEDLISPIKEHDKESVPFKVGEEVMEANITPYLPTLEEPILSPIDDIRSKDDEEFLALSLYEDECSNSLEEEQYLNEVEAEVTHILNPLNCQG
uniref:Hybrid signal transduction histidine kinase M n=1 Tax=Tanacetum cinerariifolium TaxID=118510 RepID=A0A699HYR2_TANCI|nr:hybrid signal transduction histidine kinase M [Tanacetum cinerariifolium]